MSLGRPATGRFEPNARRTTLICIVVVFAGFAWSSAETVTRRGPSSVIAGAVTVVVNSPAVFACAVPVTSPPIATGPPGVKAVPDTTTRWPDAKHVPATVIAAACAAGANNAPTETATAPAIAGRRRVRRERVANEVRS